MVDFTKLLNQTPEEREAARNEAQAAFHERIGRLINTRLRQVEDLQKLQGLGEWEERFVDSMRRIAEQHDPITGRAGGNLAFLTDTQVTSFEKLVAKTQQSTRSQRYGVGRPRN
jgi:hypothetical protein